MKRTCTSFSMTFAAMAFSVPLASAAGSYDGSRVVDAPAAAQAQPVAQGGGGCEAVRIPFKIVDNKITGTLKRAPYGTGRVEAGSGSSASPISGAVQPDGTFTAQWGSYHGTGKLSGDTAELTWSGECGPRKATGGRLQK